MRSRAILLAAAGCNLPLRDSWNTCWSDACCGNYPQALARRQSLYRMRVFMAENSSVRPRPELGLCCVMRRLPFVSASQHDNSSLAPEHLALSHQGTCQSISLPILVARQSWTAHSMTAATTTTKYSVFMDLTCRTLQ